MVKVKSGKSGKDVHLGEGIKKGYNKELSLQNRNYVNFAEHQPTDKVNDFLLALLSKHRWIKGEQKKGLWYLNSQSKFVK